MENWKRAVVAGSVGTSAILFVKGKRPAGVLMAGVGLAVLASEYPEKFERLREELPWNAISGFGFAPWRTTRNACGESRPRSVG